MSIAEKLTAIAENVQKVYDAGEAAGGGTDEWELIEEITVSEEAVVERKYDTRFKKIVVLLQTTTGTVPRARLTSGAHYWEFYYASLSNVVLVGDFIVPGIFADVHAILGNGGSNPSLAMSPINRLISNARYFDGFKTDAVCKAGTTIKVYGVKA